MSYFYCSMKGVVIMNSATFDSPIWHMQLDEGSMVESVLDRITSNAYIMVLTGESMRRYKAEV